MEINGVLLAGQHGGSAPRWASRVTRKAAFLFCFDCQHILGQHGAAGRGRRHGGEARPGLGIK